MEEQQPAQDLVLPKAPFPSPPPFWRHFTTANLERLKELEEFQDQQGQSSTSLPFELTCLRPPPPPPSTLESYTTFSQTQPIDTKPLLPAEELLLFDTQKPINHAVLLTRLTKSLLLNFLELISVLSSDPTQHTEKMDDIRQLLVNVHAVINMYRPHQARESVKEMLEGMLEDGEKEIEECDRVKNKVENFLSELRDLNNETSGDHEKNTGETNGVSGHVDGRASHHVKEDDAKRLWRMIHEIGNESDI